MKFSVASLIAGARHRRFSEILSYGSKARPNLYCGSLASILANYLGNYYAINSKDVAGIGLAGFRPGANRLDDAVANRKEIQNERIQRSV